MKKLVLYLMFPTFCFGQIDVPIQNTSTDSNVRYRLFATKNIYNFIKLDTRNGLMWQVQWSTKGRSYRFETVLNEKKFANSVEEIKELAIERYKADSAYWEEKKENWYKKKSDTTLTEEDFYYKTEEDLASWYKPKPLEESIKSALEYSPKSRNGRFFLYPTDNIYNFILLDQIDGRAWQVQWNIEKSDRMVIRIY